MPDFTTKLFAYLPFNRLKTWVKSQRNKALVTLLLASFALPSYAAVVLQYHHVSSDTPKSTSISPDQFRAHLQYLADNQFKVVPLSEIVDAIKHQQPMPDRAVAITFDDAFRDILTNAKPILDQFNFPYTIFVNPGVVEKNSKSNLTWDELKSLAEQNVIIANHGYYHDSLARKPSNINEQDWLTLQTELLLKSEQLIKEKTGANWRYFAYPYGEFTPALQTWLTEHGFVGFSQQSGAIGLTTDTSILPRFPVSQPYDKIASLRDKLNSLAFTISFDSAEQQTIFPYQEKRSSTFNIEVNDFNPNQVNCYVSGLGRQKLHWQDNTSFTINFSKPLPSGRVRSNCTAPSLSKPGRFYWYSKPWFVLKPNGEWYPL